jgi:hypothetical protein
MSEEHSRQQARTAVRVFGWCARFAVLSGLLAISGGPGPLSWSRAAFAEQPRIEVLARRIHALHDARPSLGTMYSGEGIWSFVPESGLWSKLAPYSGLSLHGIVDTNGVNRLQATEDRIVIQSWPGVFELDAVTLRLLRRTPPFAEPELWGWSLYGPVVGASEAKALGLAPGIYGHPWCGLPDLGDGILCPFHQFPGADEPTNFGDSRTILFRSARPDQAGHSFAFTLDYPQWPTLGRCLGLDLERKRWWAISADTLVALPVVPGGAGAPSESVEPKLPPSGGYPSQMWQWFRDPARKLSLARLTGSLDGAPMPPYKFVAFDDSYSLTTTYAVVSSSDPKPLPPMPISFAQLSGLLSEAYEQTIPIIGHAKGERDTFWTSDLWVFNPSEQSTTVRIRRVTTPNAERSLELPARASIRINDALSWVGGGPSGDGAAHDALIATSPYRWGAQLVATSRTFTPAPEPELRAAGGTMGHAVTAVPTRLGYSNHLGSFEMMLYGPENGISSQVLLDLREPGRFRHNLGVVNDSSEPLEVVLRWPYHPRWDGVEFPEGVEQRITVPARSVKVTAIEPLFPASVRDHWPPKIGVAASRAAIIWLSMVDNTTGDATFVPYTQLFLQGNNDHRAAIPVVAHNPGSRGTFWITDVYGWFWDRRSNVHEGRYDLDRPKAFFRPFKPSTQCGGEAATSELVTYLDGTVGMSLEEWAKTRAPGVTPPPPPERLERDWNTVFPDVARLFPQCANDTSVKGALELRTGSWMTAYSRTYTTRADGGTYGEMLPLYPYEGWPVQHFAGIEVGKQFRVNIGLYNGNKDHAITHRLSLYKADGTLYAQHEIMLKPWESMQERIEKMLGVPYDSIPAGTYGLTVLPLDDPEKGIEGRSWAYVSLVDNVTGDPTNWW